MKLSERMDSIGIRQVSAYAGEVRALEAELADALDLPSHLSATEVIEEAKVRRADLQEQWEAMLYAEHCAQEDAAEGRRGVAILTIVYEMREHALRLDHDAECAALRARVHANNDAERARYSALHRRAQAAESLAVKRAREVATLRVRLAGAIAKIPPMDLRRELDPIKSRCSTCDIGATYGTRGRQGCPECDGTGRPIPPAALEASDVASRCPFCRGARCVPGVLPDQPDRCVACAPDAPPSSGGARGLDAAERFVLEAPTVCPTHETGSGFCSFDCPDRVPNPAYPGARRRVTERVEDERPCETCGNLACETRGSHQCALLHVARLRAAIAERDARIEALEAETALWRKATGHDDAEHLDFVLGRAGIDTHLRVAYELRAEAITRAERAEAVIARVRASATKVPTSASVFERAQRLWAVDVLAILDGKEGA